MSTRSLTRGSVSCSISGLLGTVRLAARLSEAASLATPDRSSGGLGLETMYIAQQTTNEAYGGRRAVRYPRRQRAVSSITIKRDVN